MEEVALCFSRLFIEGMMGEICSIFGAFSLLFEKFRHIVFAFVGGIMESRDRPCHVFRVLSGGMDGRIPSMFLPRLLVGKRSEGIRSTFSCVLLEESLEEIVPLFLRFFFGGDLVHSLCGLGGESSEEFVPCFERFLEIIAFF